MGLIELDVHKAAGKRATQYSHRFEMVSIVSGKASSFH